MEKLPYKKISLQEHEQVRLFEKDVDSEELKWHRDREHRIVKHVSGEGWLLQLDDSLPTPISPGASYQIPAGVWHRILRREDCTDLVVEVRMFM